MSDGGKGSAPRPFSVPKKTFDENWEKIFGKKDQSKPASEEKVKDER